MAFILNVNADTNVTGAQTLVDLLQLGAGVGVVQWRASGVPSTFTPFIASPLSVTPGIPFTPSSPGEGIACALDGQLIFATTWVTGIVSHNELFVLTTGGGSMTVDSDNIDLIAGKILAIGRIGNASAIIQVAPDAGGQVFYRLDVTSGSISATLLTTTTLDLDAWHYVHDSLALTYNPGSGAWVTIDPTGSIVASVTTPTPGPPNLRTVLPVDANHVVVFDNAGPFPSFGALLQLDPLIEILSSAFLISFMPNALGDDYAQVTGPSAFIDSFLPAKIGRYFVVAGAALPPGDSGWTNGLPTVTTFGSDPLSAGGGGGFTYVDSPPSHFNDRGYLTGGSDPVTKYWPAGVGDNTVLTAYVWNDGVSQSINLGIFGVSEEAGPHCHVTAAPLSGPEPLAVTVDATGTTTSLPPAVLVRADIDWGDGHSTTGGLTQTHTYTGIPAGTDVLAHVTVVDFFGQACTTTITVHMAGAVPPPQRQFPRDDGLGASARRNWPPVTSTQFSSRRGPTAIT